MATAFSVFLCFCVCLRLGICQLDEDASCTAVNGGAGTCIILTSCQPFMDVMQNTTKVDNIWLLRQAHCDFDGNTPKVCCPIVDQNDEKVNLVEPETQSTAKNEKPTAIPSSTVLPLTTSTLPPTTSTLTAGTNVVNKTRRTGPNNINYNLLSFVAETCKTVYNTTGSCTDLNRCKPFLALAQLAQNHPAAARTLKQAHCGFSGTMPKVCCPLRVQPGWATQKTSTELPSTGPRAGGDLLTALPGETCKTVYNTTGSCTKLNLCKPFLALAQLAQNHPAAAITLKLGHCGFCGTMPKVCCPLRGQSGWATQKTSTELPSTDPKAGEDLLTALPDETCKTVYNTTGSCTELNLCKPFLALAQLAQNHPAAAITLKQAHCGFSGTMPKVCCPLRGQSGRATQRNSTELPPTGPRAGGDLLTALPGGTCKTVYNTTGSCTDLNLCKPFLALAQLAQNHPAAAITLKLGHCGFSGNMPKVCCPLRGQSGRATQKTSTKLPSTGPRAGGDMLTALPDETCKTVYNTTGSCTELNLCKPFLALAQLAQNHPATAITLKQAHCGFSGIMPKVCCPLRGQSGRATQRTSTELPSTGPRAGGDFLTALPAKRRVPWLLLPNRRGTFWSKMRAGRLTWRVRPGHKLHALD